MIGNNGAEAIAVPSFAPRAGCGGGKVDADERGVTCVRREILGAETPIGTAITVVFRDYQRIDLYRDLALTAGRAEPERHEISAGALAIP